MYEMNRTGMMRAVWMNPLCEACVLACADALHDTLGWPIEDCVSHAKYHASRSVEYRAAHNLPETGEYED